VEELEAKAKKVMEEMTRMEYLVDNVDKERKQAMDHAAKLEQQLVIINKEKQKVKFTLMDPTQSASTGFSLDIQLESSIV
jgi:hypothetical protein